MNSRRARAVASAATASLPADGSCAAPLTARCRPRSFSVRYVPLALALAAVVDAPTARAGALRVDHHVPFTPETAIIGHFSATKKPVLTQGIHAMIPKKLFLDEPDRYWFRTR